MALGTIIFYFVLLCLVIKLLPFFKNSGIKVRFLWACFLLKFLVSFLMYYVYTYYYPNRIDADIFKFFDDSEIIYNSFFNSISDFKNLIFETNIDTHYYVENYLQHMNNWERLYDNGVYNDNRLLIKINAFFRFISFHQFHVHSLFFCFLSLTGLVAFCRVLKKFIPNNSILILLLFFLPSLLFWTSGILKESLHVFALGLFIFSITNILNHKTSGSSIVILISSLLLILYIKPFIFLAIAPPLIGYGLANYIKLKKWKIYLSILLFFALFLFFSTSIVPSINLLEILKQKQTNFILFSEFQEAGSQFHLTRMDNSIIGFLSVVPEGVLNCFIRPLPWEINGFIEIPIVIENSLIILFVFILIWLVLKKHIVVKEDHKNFIWFSVVYILILYSIIGVTTPVSGSLVRYKVSALPFLIFVLLYFFQNLSFVLTLEKKINRFVCA